MHVNRTWKLFTARIFCLGLLLLLAACNLGTAPPPTPIPPDLPAVEFLNLTNDSTVLEGTNLTIDVLGSDANPQLGVVKIQLLVDDSLHQEVSSSDEQPVPELRVLMNWLAQNVGLHSLTLIAYRADGGRSSETRVLLRVLPVETATPATPLVGGSPAAQPTP